MTHARRTGLVVAAAATAVGALVYLGLTRAADEAGSGSEPMPAPFLIFRTLAPPEAHGRVALLRLDPVSADRHVTGLSCTRVHYAAGRGLCAVQEGVGNDDGHVVYVFDRTMRAGARIDVRGVPTRIRISPDGRHGAITSYAEEESPQGERLATGTLIVQMATGQVLGDVRSYSFDTRATPGVAGPVDVGGVAFENDGDRFFAAVITPHERYIAAGSVGERRVTTLRAGLISEALSPNGRFLIVKKPREHGFWQLAVLDLRTWTERDLQQGDRSVDDQVEWFDEDHVLYHDADDDSTSLWILPSDGSGGRRVLLDHAYSGSVERSPVE